MLRFIRENPGQTGKREIARAFGLKGQQKIALKALLKELKDEGVIASRGKRLAGRGQLPSVTVLDVVARDRDGGLLARPVQWDETEDGKAPTVAIARDTRGRAPTPGVGDRVLARISQRDEGSPQARVMKIVGKGGASVLGVFRGDAEGGRIEPVDRRREELVVPPDGVGEARDGDLVEVAVQKRRGLGLDHARIETVVGSVNSEKAISLIALHEHAIPTVFPPEAIAEAEDMKPATMKGREDWRDVPLITIDPATAKDHDDAVYAEADDDPDNEGGVVAYVAIADVSHYVRSGTALDREAQKRGNSVYFPDRVVPMLPERISNDLCSLKELEDRPAMAVRMVFGADGRKRRHSFHRVMMKSHVRLAYEEAQDAIDGRDAPRAAPHLETILRPLWNAYAVLKRGRDARQPLEINAPERRIELNEDGGVKAVTIPPRLDAHRLIEEFMIQANVAAGEELERKGQPLIYRVHDAPTLAKMEALSEFLRTLSIKLPKGQKPRPSTFNGILERFSETDQEQLVNNVVLRSQSQAQYDPVNIGHFGLNLRRYAHFTSPIRRYADLIVHRALVAALRLGEGGLTREEEEQLDVIAEAISLTERRAALAERQTIDRLVATHLRDKVGAEFTARINGVTRAGLFVTLDETGADGFIPISHIGDDYYHYDEAAHQVTGDETGLVYRMGDPVTVRLEEVAPVAGAMRFSMVSEGREADGLPRSERRKSRSPAGRHPKGRSGRRFGAPRSNRRRK